MVDIEMGEAIDIAGVAVVKYLWRSRDDGSIVVQVATPARTTIARLEYRRPTSVSPDATISHGGFRGRHVRLGVEAPRDVRISRLAREPRKEAAC